MKITRELLKSVDLRPFSKNDYYGFEVMSPIPMLAETEEFVLVVDGSYAELYSFDADGCFEIMDQCADIRELPFKTDKQLRVEAEIAKMEEAINRLKAELN